MAKVSRGSEQVMVRMPDGMRDLLKKAADDSGRSLNSEIVNRLSEANKTLRDEFAMAALAGLMAHETIEYLSPNDIAERAYEKADAMIRIREGGAK